MFQWDAVDTGPDLGDHNVLETFEMAIRHKRRTTRTELESFLSLDLFLLKFKNISLALLGGANSLIAPSPWIRPCRHETDGDYGPRALNTVANIAGKHRPEKNRKYGCFRQK